METHALGHGDRHGCGVRRGLGLTGVLAVLNASAVLGQSPPPDRESAAPRPFGRWGRAMLLLVIGLLVANGCASMRHGRSQVVLVNSEPPGATILVGGEPAGATPDFVELRRRGAVVTLEKHGFLPEAIELGRSISAGVQSEATLSALL